MQKFSVKNLSEYKSFVNEVSKQFTAKCIVLLSGSMGVGKTEFVKIFCQLRGLENIASPTFAIHHHYENSDISVEHLDLYRIEDESELESTGFWDLFVQDKAVIFIEWPEKMDTNQLPKNWDIFEFKFQMNSQGSRDIQLVRRSMLP